MKSETHFIGKKNFGSEVDVTDPCYNRDVWCRLNNVKIKPGVYDCLTHTVDEGKFGIRTARIEIRKEDAAPELFSSDKFHQMIGEIGVDAGLAGFFNNKPDYTDEQWVSEYVDHCGDDRHGRINKDGFYSVSGYGDGEYDVYAVKDSGDIVGLYIVFIN